MATVYSSGLLDASLEIGTPLGRNCVPTMGSVRPSDIQSLASRAGGPGLCHPDHSLGFQSYHRREPVVQLVLELKYL